MASTTTTSATTLNFSKYTVDLWWTDFNDVEFGLFKHTKHRAKSRQFSKDSDVIGAIEVNGQRTGLLTYRRGLWDDATGTKKRLVVKLFSEEMNWRGTMDMMLARSLQLTFGARGFPVASYLVNLSGHEQVTTVERSGRKWAFLPENYSFFIADDKAVRFYRLRRDPFGIGSDYTLYDAAGVRVGHLNGRVLSLGGRWQVQVREDHDSPRLNNTLQLFCGMLRFRRAAERHIRQLAAGIKAGTIKPEVEAQELDLYLNPRRAQN